MFVRSFKILVSTFLPLVRFGNETWDKTVAPRVRELVLETVSSWPNRTLNHRENSFELLGLDIMLAEDLKVRSRLVVNFFFLFSTLFSLGFWK